MFIDAVLFERIRNKSTLKFKLNEFKKLDSLQECNKYAQSTLKRLGDGSARAVFLLSSKKVLKIAHEKSLTTKGTSDAGIAQNRSEVNVFKNPRVQNIVAKIYEFDEGFKWIISDLVLEFNDDFEMATALKIDGSRFGYDGDDIPRLMKRIIDFNEDIDDLMDYSPEDAQEFEKFIIGIQDLVDRENLHSGEFDSGHFGKTRDGRVVLYDYGATREVIKQHY